MNYLGKVFNNWKYFYGEINAATLTGAIDVIVVEQPDGSYTCSPFHVRFGKMGVLRSKEKIVDIEINGEPVDIHMKLGESGEAFFVEEVEEENVPPHLACSPIPPDSGEDAVDVNRLEAEDQGGGGKEELVSPALSGPCTFRAEKVEAETLLEPTEFRPIVGQNSSTSLSGLDTDYTKEDCPSADERQSATASNTSSGKRKRRKKSTKKKSQQMKRSSLPADDGAAPEVIFQLDDLDSQSSDLLLPQTSSSSQPSAPSEPSLAKATSFVDTSLNKVEVGKPLDLSGVTHDGHDIHFFSDTEITPGSSPREGCDFGPIQSDSEFETKRLTETEERSGPEETSQSQWKWGELPTSSSLDDSKQDSQKWMLQNMLGFMKKTKHMRHKTESDAGGIYLSELNSDDPEMAALYFPSTHRRSAPSLGPIPDYQEGSREEDAESGNGPSLPQSPHSVEGAVCGPKPSDPDFDLIKGYPEDLALSLCGPNPTLEHFEEGLISYSDFVDSPQLLSNPKLVVRINGKFYSWRSAAPLLVSILFFQKTLPQDVLSRLSESEMEGEELRPDVDKGKESKKSYSWWWSRNNPKYEDPQLREEEETKPVEVGSETEGAPKEEVAKRPISISSDLPTSDQPLDLSPQNRAEITSVQPEEPLKDEGVGTPDFNNDKFRKTLRLTSTQIASLNLKPGANEVQFSVTTAYQGTSKCKCFLFCWRYDDKIVISDIDGTITKSDVLGHILPIVGKDWAQSGVAKLFTKIKDNGYKLLYLSARAIGQSRFTREYLKSIKQEDLGLPEGPMLLNPTSLLTAFHTEVIERKPEEFKISCLRDIQALFPSHIKPFYAGYGNKINDVWAYQAVGIPIFRIFTINHRGELKHELTQTFQSSYIGQSTIVNDLFPPMPDKVEAGLSRTERREGVDIMFDDEIDVSGFEIET